MPPPDCCHHVPGGLVFLGLLPHNDCEHGTGPPQRSHARRNTYGGRTTGTVCNYLLPSLLQALRSRRLQHLQLPESFAGGSFIALAALLPPLLVSLKSNQPLPLAAASIGAHFPAPLSLESLDAVYSFPNRNTATLAHALPLLCERLPVLTHLTLRPDAASAGCAPSRHAASLGRPLLAALSYLQQLHVSGGAMVAGVAASLPLLPALTRLQLGGMFSPQHASILASLNGLRCLHLPPHNMLTADEKWTAATLAAVKRMRGLTELVLDAPVEGRMQRSHPFLMLKPLPATLRRLVVAHEESLEEAMRVFGLGAVDEICASGH
jgi:hypothetical protein